MYKDQIHIKFLWLDNIREYRTDVKISKINNVCIEAFAAQQNPDSEKLKSLGKRGHLLVKQLALIHGAKFLYIDQYEIAMCNEDGTEYDWNFIQPLVIAILEATPLTLFEKLSHKYKNFRRKSKKNPESQ